MTPISPTPPAFGCGNSQGPRFGNSRIATEATARIQMLQDELKQCHEDSKNAAKQLDGYNGFDTLLQSGLILGGGLTAFFGLPLVGSALVAYPLITNLYKTIQNFK